MKKITKRMFFAISGSTLLGLSIVGMLTGQLEPIFFVLGCMEGGYFIIRAYIVDLGDIKSRGLGVIRTIQEFIYGPFFMIILLGTIIFLIILQNGYF